MILLPRRTFFALCALIIGTTAFLLLAIAAQHGIGPLARFTRHPLGHRSPTLAGHAFAEGDANGAIAAYQGIEVALTKGTLANVAANAARIAEAFGEINPDIAASARRLARLRDVTAARREFERLTDLFARRSREPNDETDDEEDEPPAARSLEV